MLRCFPRRVLQYTSSVSALPNPKLRGTFHAFFGAIAQLGERLPCTQEVSGSIPLGSTIILSAALAASSHTPVCFLLAALHKALWLSARTIHTKRDVKLAISDVLRHCLSVTYCYVLFYNLDKLIVTNKEKSLR